MRFFDVWPAKLLKLHSICSRSRFEGRLDSGENPFFLSFSSCNEVTSNLYKIYRAGLSNLRFGMEKYNFRKDDFFITRFLFFFRFPEFKLKHLEFLVKNHNTFVEVLFQCLPSSFKGQFQEKKFGIFISSNVFAFSTTTFGHPLKFVQQVYQNCNLESRGIVRRKIASSMKPYSSELFELQSTDFMISANCFDRFVESAIYEFGWKRWREGLFVFTIFRIFFWLWAKLFLILVWISSTGLWKLQFMCSEEISRHFWKSSWLFRRLRILNANLKLFRNLDEPFPQGCQRAFSSPEDYIVEKLLFLRNLYYCFPFSNFERKSIGFWKKITALLLKLDEVCSVDHLEEKIFPKKTLIPNQFRTIIDFSLNYCLWMWEGRTNLYSQVQKRNFEESLCFSETSIIS